MLRGIDALLSGASNGRSDFAKITSINYSQYVKLDLEYKHYFNLNHATLVGRAYGGLGIPYGHSDVLPYIKQFTAGGPNSLRGWRLRSLGPGAYLDPNLNNPNTFIDQTGEMKLEGNVEFRFDIFKMFGGFLMLKGAAFVDAGNIWNLYSDPNKPGSEFKLNQFYQEIAVSSGLGLRLDFSYAVLRLDFATPLKVPYLPDRYGWIVHTIHPFDKSWRKNNLIFNFAVGYPF
jgi:outer membrane protein assembly factor BamA